MAAVKVRREITAGYTTFAMSTLPVDVIDPKSGAVIRGKLEEPSSRRPPIKSPFAELVGFDGVASLSLDKASFLG